MDMEEESRPAAPPAKRRGRKPFREMIANGSPRPLSDALRGAIEASGLGPYSLARKAGRDELAVRKMILGTGDIALAGADKLFEALGLGVVGYHAGPDDTPLSPSDALRAAIAASGLNPHALGGRSGVAPMHVRRLILGQGDVVLTTADRLAHALGLRVVARPDGRPARPHRQPLSDALRAAIAASGLTAAELGKATGCDVFSLGRFVDGKGSLMLATVDKLFIALRLGVGGPGPEADDPPLLPSEALRAAILASGLNVYAVARKAGGHSVGLYMFVRGECDLKADSADGLFDALGLKVVCGVEARPPESVEADAPIDDPMKPLNESLRAAITADGIGVTALARRSGLSHATISRFVNRKRDLTFIVATKVAAALGLELGPAMLRARPTEASTVAEVPAVEPESSELHAELAKLTEKQRRVVSTLIEAEPDGLIGAAVRCASGVPGWWKMLRRIKESSQYWAPRIFFPDDFDDDGEKYHIKVN